MQFHVAHQAVLVSERILTDIASETLLLIVFCTHMLIEMPLPVEPHHTNAAHEFVVALFDTHSFHTKCSRRFLVLT